MSIVSYIVILVLTFICLWQLKRFTCFQLVALSRRDLLIGWGIKITYSILFMLVFTQFYGNGNLYGDAANFMKDSQLIHDYALEKPLDYFQILTGFGDDKNRMMHETLAQTNIWSAGENGDFINDNRLLLRINSVIHFMSFGNSYVHGLIMSFLSMIGSLLIYSSFQRFINNKRIFYYLLIALPSIGFWGSGLTKEALLIFGLGIFFFAFFKLGKDKKIGVFGCFVVAIGILLFNKPHVGLIVIAFLPLLILARNASWKKIGWVAFPGSVGLLLIALTYTPSKINLLDKISYKQKDLINMGKGGVFFVTDSSFCAFEYDQLENFELISPDSLRVLKSTKGEAKLFGQYPFAPFEIKPSKQAYAIYLIQPPSGSYLPTEPINYSRKALFSSIPHVLFNTLIRPIPGDQGSNLKYFSMVNNLLLLLLILLWFMNRKKLNDSEKYVVMYLLLTSLVILLIIGWTTPILGAIARYKMVVELFIVVLLSIGLKPIVYVKK